MRRKTWIAPRIGGYQARPTGKSKPPPPPTPCVRASVGDRVRVTLEGVLTDFDEFGRWTLHGCSVGGHVPWDYTLHWGSRFTPVVSTDPEGKPE